MSTDHINISTGEYVRDRRIAEMLDISVRTLHRKVAKGEFPRPLKLGKGTTRWRMRDVVAFLERSRSR